MRILVGVIGLSLLAVLAAVPVSAQAQEDPETYVVRQDDTLYSIARRFDTSVEMLRRLNDLPDNTIYVGQELIIRPADAPSDPAPPDAPVTEDTPPDTTPDDTTPDDTIPADTIPADSAPSPDPPVDTGSTDTGRLISAFDAVVPASETLTGASINRLTHGAYVIQDGDTFFSIAARYGTTADSLFALNGAHTDPLPAGKVIRLPERFALPSHVVQERDSTIYGIAAEYGVSVRALLRANDLDEPDIEVGQRLRIPGRTAPEPAARGTLPKVDARGPVAVYPDPFEGRLTASGIRYDPDALVVSHPELPFGSVVLLTSPETERSTFARVIDRGPVDEELLVDVSAAVAERLGLTPESEQPVALRVVR